MKPLYPDAEFLLREWVGKADADLEVARMICEAADNLRIRKIVGFQSGLTDLQRATRRNLPLQLIEEI